MTTNSNMILGLTGVTLGFLSLAVALWTLSAARHWRACCASLESSLASLQRELDLASSISVKAGRRVSRIEQEYASIADRVEQVERRGPERFFDQAIECARRGADPGKLARQFGLSCGEAELLTRLHGRKKLA